MRRLAEIPPLYVYIVSTLWGLVLQFRDNASSQIIREKKHGFAQMLDTQR